LHPRAEAQRQDVPVHRLITDTRKSKKKKIFMIILKFRSEHVVISHVFFLFYLYICIYIFIFFKSKTCYSPFLCRRGLKI
jgi:hypothetical protein